MNIYQLRRQVQCEEIDYNMLKFALSDYSRPREKISCWLKTGELIRVKKGLYVFGPQAAQSPYSKEVLANLIYGPSVISLSYALAYYGMIPERVETVTSITNNRNKKFQTPLGVFTYQYLNHKKYSIGIEQHATTNKQPFLIAAREKALCDQMYFCTTGMQFLALQDIEIYLLEDLRMDETSLKELSVEDILEINNAYKSSTLTLLSQYLISRKA